MRCALLCLFAVACGGGQIQERKVAAKDVAKVGPATLEATKPREGDPREAKIRVWVDAGVRALPGWKEDLNDQIDYASQLLTPLLGVRLKIEGFKDWNRTGDPRDALKELASTDDGKDVIWVIGYVTPGDKASKAMSELGDAQLLGKHIIVRGWAEKPETDALASSLPDLGEALRKEVMSAHKRHKQSVVLLHFLARTLGAVAEQDPTWIGNPSYSPKQASFADRTRDLMQTAVDRMLSEDATADIAKELLEKISRENWGGWLPGDRDEITSQLTAIVNAGKQGEAAADVPVAALEQFERIKVLARKGDMQNALAELENLLVAYPGNAAIYELKCELLLAKPGVKDKTTRAACARVSELAPGEPSPHFAVATALVKEKDIAGARAELELAAIKIAALKQGNAEQWKKLIAFYSALGSLTWSEEALAMAKLENDPMAAEIASTRARYGVPKGAKFVKPQDEAELVNTVQEALSLVYANKHAEAQKKLAAGEKKWPGAPGFAAVRCDLALRQTQLDAARGACNRALAADPNESWALYLSGVIALKDTSANGTKLGIDKLKKAITVDPTLGQAWRTLAKAYARAKDQAALDQLAKDYAAKFGQPLPR
jgi:predicted Zn-dependent protease